MHRTQGPGGESQDATLLYLTKATFFADELGNMSKDMLDRSVNGLLVD